MVRVVAHEFNASRGAVMPQTELGERTQVDPVRPGRTRYAIARKGDTWFITFDGRDYGPYRSEREAKLFAVDAANELGTYSQDTQVVLVDDDGVERPVWTYGLDRFPPRY